jgi:hypothetical protein
LFLVSEAVNWFYYFIFKPFSSFLFQLTNMFLVFTFNIRRSLFHKTQLFLGLYFNRRKTISGFHYPKCFLGFHFQKHKTDFAFSVSQARSLPVCASHGLRSFARRWGNSEDLRVWQVTTIDDITSCRILSKVIMLAFKDVNKRGIRWYLAV